MPTLRELQSDFRRFVAGEARPALLEMIDSDDFDPASLLSIYRNNSLITLTAALSSTFPVVRRLVDKSFFDFAAHTFIRENFPSAPCLVEYGSEFPAFLGVFPPAKGVAYLPDVARLEWAINRVIHAPKMKSIQINSLAEAQSDPARIRVRIDPATRFVTSAYPTDRIWEANRTGVEPTEMRLESDRVHLQIRGGEAILIRNLSAASWIFRAGIADGAPLGTAVESALEVDPTFDLSSELAALFEESLVVGIYD